MQACEGELNAHRQDDQSHEPRKGIRANPPSWALPATRVTRKRTSQVTSPATATATKAVTGRPNPVWAAESVMTPVIVPGLAAKRINGVNDASGFVEVSRGV